jgi:hypothetical protein
MPSGKLSERWRKGPGCSRRICNSRYFPAEGNRPMPKLAANLHYMFDEVPFLDRFAMAAHAGFKAVEFQVPYDWRVEALVERLQHHSLKMAIQGPVTGTAASVALPHCPGASKNSGAISRQP